MGGDPTFINAAVNGEVAPKNEPARAGGSACRGRRVFGEVMCGSA